MMDERYQKALDAAAKQLSYRALSVRKLREKLLEKGFEEHEADYAAAWLIERGLLDDAAFAESVCRSYARKGYGAGRIRQELQQRGVSREDADAAMEGFVPAQSVLLALLDKRLKGDVSDKKELDKAIAALQRRGFGWQEIRDALKAYGDSAE